MGIFGGAEPQLVTDGDIYGKLLEIIKAAREKLVIVSPYLDPTGDLIRQVVEAHDKGVAVSVTFRRDKLAEYKKADWFTTFASAGISLGTVDRLHSKIYANERMALVTSMNFHRSSITDSLEVGVLFEAEHKRMTEQLDGYLAFLDKRVEEAAPPVAKRAPKVAGRAASIAKSEHGHCIRCGTDIPLNKERPYCEADWRKWAVYKNDDYPDKFCHRCGKPHPATKRRPVCGECYSKAA